MLEISVVLPKEVDENTRILRELEAFKAINPSPIVIIIIDDGMEPIYSISDFVAENNLLNQDIKPRYAAKVVLHRSKE